MTPLDAAFLEVEDAEPGVSLAISSIAVFDGPAPDPAEFRAAIAGRLPLIPRYRQKAREVPFDLGPPVWVDDPHFDLDDHLRRTALPAPGGPAELRALMSRVMSARLRRERPLWEYWVVEGLTDGRWALISKVHHCMVDGVSGTDLYRVILDATPEPRPPVPDRFAPAPEPSALNLAAEALRELAGNPVTQARAVVDALRRPLVLGRAALVTARGIAALAGALVPARASSLSGSLSPERRFTWAGAPMADVAAVRHGLGGTVNDVVLAAVTGGFRALLLARGETPDAHTVRALVPVSVRAPGDEGIRDNRVSLMLAALPVHVADPPARLAAVRAELDRLKTSGEAEAGAAITAVAALEPFPLVGPGVRIAAHLPQRAVVTVTTNVPGPHEQLYALGRPLLELIPYVPIASTVRIGVSIMTYRGQVRFGITGDHDSATDVEVLARGIEDGLAALVTVAGVPAADRAAR